MKRSLTYYCTIRPLEATGRDMATERTDPVNRLRLAEHVPATVPTLSFASSYPLRWSDALSSLKREIWVCLNSRRHLEDVMTANSVEAYRPFQERRAQVVKWEPFKGLSIGFSFYGVNSNNVRVASPYEAGLSEAIGFLNRRSPFHPHLGVSCARCTLPCLEE
jgi:hypothetical protein